MMIKSNLHLTVLILACIIAALIFGFVWGVRYQEQQPVHIDVTLRAGHNQTVTQEWNLTAESWYGVQTDGNLSTYEISAIQLAKT